MDVIYDHLMGSCKLNTSCQKVDDDWFLWVSRVLEVCNIDDKNLFCQNTYRHARVLARDENGCSLVKKAITVADDLLKSDFLDLFAEDAYERSMDDLGISLIQHVLSLDFTQRTTQDNTRLHELLAEFDEILPTSDLVELHRLASKLTSDSDLFVEFVNTKRGSLMAHIILGKSEEVDLVFSEAIRQSYTDVVLNHYGRNIIVRTVNLLEKRGNSKFYDQILRLSGYNALYLATEPDRANFLLRNGINFHQPHCTELIACGLQCHYIELSFLKHGSNIVAHLLCEDEKLPLICMVMEIVMCDEDTLVRLANDEYGNPVLKKTLELAKEHRPDLFGDLVDKLKPLLDCNCLRGSRGENIVAFIIEK